MRRRLLSLLAVAAAAGGAPVPLSAPVAPLAPAGAAPYPGAPSCPDQPADSWWHSPVAGLPVHPMSATYVASMGLTNTVHADFGSGLWNGGPIGIPFTTVAGSQARVPVSFDYDDESDPGPYPIPANAPIEGGPSSSGDRHVLVVDRDACVLYELYDAHPTGGGGWTAGSGAVFDLRSNALRPDGWTSADAAGLPILPGLVRYDEVASGEIDHAIRVTARATQNLHLWPARHHAGSANPALPPMGLRLRLRASFDVSSFPAEVQVILRAMQRYGLVVADNGSSWYLSGAPDERWDNDVLHTLGRLRGSDFEAVDASSLMVSPSSGRARQPGSAAQRGRYVDRVYLDFLGRSPDAGGRAYWSGLLGDNLPRAGFTGFVSRSPEWTGALVTELYELALGRAPDAGGLAYWRGLVQAGTPTAALAAALFGSAESYALGGGTPEGYVERLYQRILGRSADPGGLAWWAARIRAGEPRTTLALSLFQSEENRRRRVTGLYADLLGRAPDAGGLTYWAGALLGMDDVVLAASLAASDEYFGRAQTTA